MKHSLLLIVLVVVLSHASCSLMTDLMSKVNAITGMQIFPTKTETFESKTTQLENISLQPQPSDTKEESDQDTDDEKKHVKEEDVAEGDEQLKNKNDIKISWHSDQVDHHSEYHETSKTFRSVKSNAKPVNLTLPVGPSWKFKSTVVTEDKDAPTDHPMTKNTRPDFTGEPMVDYKELHKESLEDKSHEVPVKSQVHKLPAIMPNFTTIVPTPHAAHDNFDKRIKETMMQRMNPPKLVVIGDTILNQIGRDKAVREAINKYHPVNLASPGYRTEHMLYRLTYSHLTGMYEAPVVFIMIGTFNIGKKDSSEAVAAGILAIVKLVRQKWAKKTKILVSSVLPRQSVSLQHSIEEANAFLARGIQTLEDPDLVFVNMDKFFKLNGRLPVPILLVGTNFSISWLYLTFFVLILDKLKLMSQISATDIQNQTMFMPDHLHPSEMGYLKIVEEVSKYLQPFIKHGSLPESIEKVLDI